MDEIEVDDLLDEVWHAPTWTDLAEIDDPARLRLIRVRATAEREIIAARTKLLARKYGKKGPELNNIRAAADIAERCVIAASVRLLELGEESPMLPNYNSILVLERAMTAWRSMIDLARHLCEDVLDIDRCEDEIPEALLTRATYRAGQLQHGIREMLADTYNTEGDQSHG